MTAPTEPRCARCGDTGVTRSVGVDMGGELDPPGRCPYCPERMTDGAVVRLLVSQAPSLTIERATELAARWAEAHGRGCSRPAAEREQLFAWVRAKAVSIASEQAWAPGRRRDHIAARTSIVLRMDGVRQARDLIDAADGWPS